MAQARAGWAAYAVAFTMAFSPRASAAVVNVGPNGFELKQVVHIAASPDQVYAALIQPARWWNSAHTFSGDAANLTLEPKVGGCLCEAMPKGGFVRHLTVVMVAPGEEIDLRGAMGPFMTRGVDGDLGFTFAAAGGGTDVTMTNNLGGYMSEGFAGWAPKADAMLADLLSRLKSYVETSQPPR